MLHCRRKDLAQGRVSQGKDRKEEKAEGGEGKG